MSLCKNCGVKERPKGRAYRYCSECAKKVKLIKHRVAVKKYDWQNVSKRKNYRYDYDRSELGKTKYQRYRNTDKYREYARNRYHSLDPNRKGARSGVINAIRDGKLLRSKNCERCKAADWGVKRSMIEAHHFKGYKPDHWLDIQWLCVDCHKKAHAGMEVVSDEVRI